MSEPVLSRGSRPNAGNHNVWRLSKIGLSFIIGLSLGLVSLLVTKHEALDSSELVTIFAQVKLNFSEPAERCKEIAEIEEADARLYGPVAGKTIYLESSTPTADSGNARPRYWLRVEDYETPALASKRAAEYVSVGTYERLASVYGKDDSFDLSKTTVRLWALARGRRVYALTTNANLFGLIQTPKTLQALISTLPEH